MTEVAENTDAEVTRLSRVSVLCGQAQVDVSVPLHMPTEVLIPELLRLFGDRISGSAEAAWSRPWRLGTVGADPLPGSQTPADAGISDGALLVLYVSEAPPPPPVFDDVFDSTAADLARGRRWDERTARTCGLAVLGLTVCATVVISLGLGGSRGSNPAGALLAQLWCGATTIVLLTGSILSARRMSEPGPMPTVLAGYATATASATGAVVVPVVSGGGDGPPQALLAAACGALAALIALRFTARGTVLHTAVLTTSVLVALAAFAALWVPDRAAIAATGTVLAYLLLVFAARLGAVAARLPLPRVPAAGERIDPIDDDPPPTVAGVGAVASGLGPAAEEPRPGPHRAVLAQSVCTGITVGASVAGACAVLGMGAGAWAARTGAPAHHIAFTLVMAIAFSLRGRTHSEPLQAASAVLSGAVMAVSTATGLARAQPDLPVVGLSALLAIAVIAVACGAAAPRITFSPVQRRIAELGEYLVIAAAGPLLGWVWDVYATVRNL
ncbi:type VII secretion integral membrane protein EccD [Tsukamurella serpentis]